MKVCVVGVPPGEAPEWVRKEWVGLVLPLADGEDGARSVRTWDALTGPKTLPAQIWCLLTGKCNRVHGFVVDAPGALEILAASAPEAEQWWRTHTAFGQPGRKLIFPAEACQEHDGSASAASRHFCPACGIMYLPADVDDGVAACRACDTVTRLDQLGQPVSGTAPPPARRRRLAIPRPQHYSVKDDDSSMRIRYWWFWRGVSKPAAICFIWNLFVVGWYWSALRTDETRIKWFALLWGVPFAANGLLLVYATLTGLVNRTVIKATSEFLTVRHGPLPMWGNRRIRVDEVERFFCDGDPEALERKQCDFYRVNALTKGAGNVNVLTQLDADQALFIEQELGRWLNLRD